MKETIHRTGIVNIFWPQYTVRAVCVQCGWWGPEEAVKPAQKRALDHSLYGDPA